MDDAEALLEFLREIFSTLREEPSEFYFLLAVLNFLKGQREENDDVKEELYQKSNDLFD